MTARSSFPCPAIRTGTMTSIRSMADGRIYDDRNDYDASLKSQGLRIYEPGEKPAEPPKPNARDIIEREMRKYV